MFPTNCTRCGDAFRADTAEYARSPGRICGRCFDDLQDDANAERLAAEADAAGRQEPQTDLF